jgi:rare lipoprotein A
MARVTPPHQNQNAFKGDVARIGRFGTIAATDRTSMRAAVAVVLVSLSAGLLTSCATRSAAPVSKPAAPTNVLATRVGLASYYGQDFHGRVAASGVTFDMNAMMAAHPSYPFGTVVRVTNLKNGRSVQVRILDRGPSSGPQADGVIIDLSRRAAQALRFIQEGRTRVRLDVLRWGSSNSR